MKQALYWEKGADGKVNCLLCPHACTLPPASSGRCRVRVNAAGALYTLNYAQISGLALDPIEKKPLYHFYPGALVLSVGSIGCNLDCGFCQNWLSVQSEATKTLAASALVDMAAATGGEGNCGLAFTYNEPLIWYEYVLAAAKEAKGRGLKTILVTNGFIRPEPWRQLLAYIDAVNIDLKAFTPRFYRDNCRGEIKPVLEAISQAVGACHVEITTLLIEGQNTDPAEIKKLSAFLGRLDRQIPLHLSRYFPARYWRQKPTSPELIHSLVAVARENLDFVYTGNLTGSDAAGTYCPVCSQLLIQRSRPPQVFLVRGCCPRCGYSLNILTREG